MHKPFYLRDDIDGRYASRKERGRVLANIQDSVNESIQGLKNCFKKNKD